MAWKRQGMEDNIIKDVKNIFRLKRKEIDDTATKDVRNLFRWHHS